MYNSNNNNIEDTDNNAWVSDYDIIIDYNNNCKLETNIFTKNVEYITILNKHHEFFTYLHDFTYNLFDFNIIIYHSWHYKLYAKFYVPKGTSILLKMSIFFAWLSYTGYHSINEEMCKIYEDYFGTLYECDDYAKSELHFYKELLKVILEKEILDKTLFQEVVNKVNNLATNIIKTIKTIKQ